jgi:geranylgeranyl pyrophosphate synthase
MTAILSRTGALEDAATMATQHAEEALSALSLLPPSQGRDLLAEYAVSVLCPASPASGKGSNP